MLERDEPATQIGSLEGNLRDELITSAKEEIAF
jgi:hypothetical protein